MLVPKRAKYRKQQRGRMKGKAYRGNKIAFGDYGLLSIETSWVTARQIEAARRAITHYIQRGGRVWIRVFPDKPITKKPPEVRMGGGKGDVAEFVVPVKPGRILFEMGGVSREAAFEALRLASHKLPVKTLIVDKKMQGNL
ncbi:MAG: 50S ribosomal protein L16 [Candidatus Levybacteria bacterium RIFCSPLOWO2_01_FULL_38_13]|nr:MAG: 50S ribosomal protein L16 [Candidatus Levybacteria bacterium RIFCSPHIGHO2_01_FULL_41_15]OGH34772.1 MAG: 50S ribosomal protein L16 [Candidatus Levybacteria bacterium RIFCSPLOWO2_01_FULL_38_13]